MDSPIPPWGTSDPAQLETLQAFLGGLGDHWVWLARSEGSIETQRVGQYSALVEPQRAASCLDDPSWDVHLGDTGPGFEQRGDGPLVYAASLLDGLEPLVHYRNWHDVRPSAYEVAEEFRLFLNLWEDAGAPGRFLEFDDSGDATEVITVTPDGVRALLSTVRRFQAAKQMVLVLYIDSTVKLTSDDSPATWVAQTAEHNVIYTVGPGTLRGETYSFLSGTRILRPPPADLVTAAWQLNRPRDYERFIIDMTLDGETVEATSDPGQLDNRFGGNPGYPSYLTAVYFRREVLAKYYGDTDRYSIEDGLIRCAGLWVLRIDNDHPDHVMVFLGDLGRDIPYEESRYWRSFNVPPAGRRPSQTLVRRAHAGQFVDPESPDLRIPSAYRAASSAWKERFGCSLYQELHEGDRHIMSRLRRPLTNTWPDVEEQLLLLGRLLVDGLNSDAIRPRSTPLPKTPSPLTLLELRLAELGETDPRGMLDGLRGIYAVRSRAAAHRKSSDFDWSKAFPGRTPKQVGDRVFRDALTALLDLRRVAEQEHNE